MESPKPRGKDDKPLTPAEQDVIDVLRNASEPLMQAAIAERAGRNKGTVSKILPKFRKSGKIEHTHGTGYYIPKSSA